MDSGIVAREFPYLGRYVQVGVASQRVISVTFPERPDEGAAGEHDLLDRIGAYLEGVEEDFSDVAVGLTVSGDRRAVLESVREIPYGTQTTVEALVRRTPGLDPSSADDEDLVREALADNPAPLLIPDHRVRDGPSGAPPEVEQKLRSLEDL